MKMKKLWIAYYENVKRVQLHPATDFWMQGDRYGDVVKVGRKYVHVKLDRSERTVRVLAQNLIPIE